MIDIQELLIYLMYVGILLLSGLLCIYLSRKIHLPYQLLLIIAGIALGSMSYNGQRILSFPPELLLGIAIISQSIILFHSSSRFRPKEFDSISISSLKLFIATLIMNSIVLTLVTAKLLGLDILLSAIFAITISSTFSFITFKRPKTRISQLLLDEANFNTPITILLALLLFSIYAKTNANYALDSIISQIPIFIQQLLLGIGAALILGLLFHKFLRKNRSASFSITLLTAFAVLSFILAQAVGGIGIVAAATFGIIYGNTHIRCKQETEESLPAFSFFIEMFHYMLIGVIMQLLPDWQFIMRSLLLFVIYLIIRFLAATFVGRNFKENLSLTLNLPKSIPLLLIIAYLATKAISGTENLAGLLFILLIYSIILSLIIEKLNYFKYLHHN